MREPVDVVSAGGRQICVPRRRIAKLTRWFQTALRSMADQWLTLEKQIEWIAETRARSIKAIRPAPRK